MIKFKTIKQGSFLSIFSIVFFSVIGLVFNLAAISGLIHGQDYPFELLIIVGLLFFGIAFFLYLQSFAWYTFYAIDEESIVIKGVYKSGKINKKDIQETSLLTQDEAQEYVTNYFKKIEKEEQILNTRDWYNSLGKYGQLLKYSTVSFSQVTAKLAEYGMKNEALFLTRNYVLIILNDKSRYILSPIESKDFISALNQPI